MRIAELYKSIQGEGLLTGVDSVFVRVSGCNLRCWFCDTPYTSWQPEGEDWAVADLLDRILAWDCQHIVITGGEPLLFTELIPLCAGLHSAGRHITIETAGTLALPVACDLMSISPKLSNSTPSVERAGAWRSRHEKTRHVPDVIRRLTTEYTYQLKFVVDCPADCTEIVEYLREFPHVTPDRVLLMPQGTDLAYLQLLGAWLEPYCAEHGYRFCARKHIEWFGARRGT